MSDPYWDDVVLLMGFEGTVPEDESPLAQTVTAYGSTAVSSSWAMFGSKSLALPASAPAGVSVPDNVAFNIGTQPFTIECFVRLTSALAATAYLVAHNDNASSFGWYLYLHRTNATQFRVRFYCEETTTGATVDGIYVTATDAFTYALDTPYHIAMDYDGTTYRVYLDGVMVGSSTRAFAVPGTVSPMSVGCGINGGGVNNTLLNGFMDEVRVTVGTARYATDTSFTVPTAAFPRSGVDPLDTVVVEGVAITDFFGSTAPATLVEGVGISYDIVGALSRTLVLVETARAFATMAVAPRTSLVAADTMALADSSALVVGVILQEMLGVLAAETVNERGGVSIGDTFNSSDALALGLPATVTEAIALTVQARAQQAVAVMESLGLVEVWAPLARYGLTAPEGLRIADSLVQFFGADVTEALSFSDAVGNLCQAPITATEALALTATVEPQLLINVVLADGVEFSDTEIVNAIYRQDISEAIEIQIGYLAPNGSFTTWVMNTRSGSVTEYQNYEFNSFARVGNTHIGASSTGLYQLQGADDDGEPIVAALEGAFMQFGATRMSRLKAAYLAVHGEDGDFVLRIETLDGDTYDYGVSTRHGRSTKVHMGKGQRTRYFAYSLTSTGQDFDIDTLEFVPLVVERRV